MQSSFSKCTSHNNEENKLLCDTTSEIYMKHQLAEMKLARRNCHTWRIYTLVYHCLVLRMALL